MSLAKVHSVTKARKDQGTCESCKTPLPAGSAYRWFSVGFRSKAQHKRCTAAACTPRPSERESSKLADVYAAQEEAEDAIGAAGSLDDVREAVQQLGEAISEVASEYEEASTDDNGTVFNVDAAERAEMLASAADECDSWEPDDADQTCEHCDGSGKDDCQNCGGTGETDKPGDAAEMCEPCGGTGQVDCEECDGSGETEELSDEALDAVKESAVEFVNDLELP